MAEIDESGRKLTIKLVYYGPAMSGKTTNLMRLHECDTFQLQAPSMNNFLNRWSLLNSRLYFLEKNVVL